MRAAGSPHDGRGPDGSAADAVSCARTPTVRPTRWRRRAAAWRRLGATSLAAAITAVTSAGGGGGSDGGAGGLTDDLAAWWQFDWAQRYADETGGQGLGVAGTGAVFMRLDDDGIERALRTGPQWNSSLQLANSADPTHWTGAAGPRTFAVGFQMVAFPASGTEQSLLARWADDATGQWRISVVPETAELEFVVVPPDGVPRRAAVPGLEVGAVYVAVAVIDPETDGGLASLRLRRADGVTIGAESVAIPGGVRATPSRLTIGRSHEDEDYAADAFIDVVAGWTRALAPAEQDALAGPDGLQRYADVAGDGPRPVGRQVDRIAGVFDGDVRHIVIGDSFVSGRGWNRVFPAVLKTRAWTPLSAVVSGVTSPGALIATETLASDASGDNPREVDIGNLFAVEYDADGVAHDHYGLPVDDAAELRVHAGLEVPADGRLWTFTTADSGMSDGATGRFARDGDTVRMRLVHRPVASVAPLESVRWAAGVTPDGAVDVDLLTGTPRQSSALDGVVTVPIDGSESAVASVFEAFPGDASADPSRVLDLTGIVAWRSDDTGGRIPGPSYATLNGASWRLRDFAQDVEADGGGNGKSYDTTQLAAWLEATTVDAARPAVFWWYVDVEPFSAAETAADARGMIDVADAACALAGLARPRHVLVLPHAHDVGGLTTDGTTLVIERFRSGYHDVVDDPAYDHVACISIFDATEGQRFDGRDESVAWLTDRGYDAFEYGTYTGGAAIDLTVKPTLFDAAGVHPVDPAAAAFFASFVTATVPDAPEPTCPADLDGDRLVGFGDVVVLLASWGPCPGCPADIDGNGIAGFTDLVEILSLWGPCDG